MTNGSKKKSQDKLENTLREIKKTRTRKNLYRERRAQKKVITINFHVNKKKLSNISPP